MLVNLHFRKLIVLTICILISTFITVEASTLNEKGSAAFDISKVDRKKYSSIDLYNKKGCLERVIINANNKGKEIEIKGYFLKEIHEKNTLDKGKISGNSNSYNPNRDYQKLISVYKNIFLGNNIVINENGIAKHIIKVSINDNYLIFKNIKNIKKINILTRQTGRIFYLSKIIYKPLEMSDLMKKIKFNDKVEIIGIFVTRDNNNKEYNLDYEVISDRVISTEKIQKREIKIILKEYKETNINGLQNVKLEINNNKCIDSVTYIKLND